MRDRASVTSISSRPRPATELEQVVARRPSRYCPSDRLLDTARRFADPAAAPIERVRAAVHHVNTTLSYVPDASGPHTDAIETLDGRTGVCRDYAHAVVALCRALDVPARVAAVYAPGLSPMDFHLVAETVLDGVWYVWDATRLAPRPTMIRIGTGRAGTPPTYRSVRTSAARCAWTMSPWAGSAVPTCRWTTTPAW